MSLLFLGLAFILIGIISLLRSRKVDNPIFGYVCLIGAVLILSIFFSPAWQDFINVYPDSILNER